MSATKKVSVFDPGLCRCCGAMTRCRVLNEQYEDIGRKEIYSDMISNCFGVKLSHLEDKPAERLICNLCVEQLRQALSFKIQVLQSEQAFLRSRTYETNSGFQIHLKSTAEMRASHHSSGFVKEEEILDDFGDDMFDGMSDGFDDEIDPELLNEYESLKAFDNVCKETAVVDSSSCRNIHQKTQRRKCSAKQIKQISDHGGYTSDDFTETVEKNTNIRSSRTTAKVPREKQLSAEIDQTDEPFMQATNITYIVKYSYVCPFKNRFNHILCYYCDQYFLEPELLRMHTNTHNPKKFKATRNRYTKIDVTRIDCRLCSQKINNLEEFKRHLVSFHGKNYFLQSKDCVLPFKLVQNMNKCTICDEEFSYFYGLYKHMNQHYSNYMCETCGMGFMDESSLQKHLPAHDSTRYPCLICGKSMKSEYTRFIHVQRIHKKDSAGSFCSKCDAFLLRHQKTKHMVEAHGEAATVPCLGCDQVFNSRRLLTLHVRRAHMKDYRYECHVCHKKFFRRSSLTLHMPTHTGERNFKCKVCEKCYPRLKTLKEHMRIHNNDRRYRCHICGQAFVQNCSLKGHMKSKHPDYG